MSACLSPVLQEVGGVLKGLEETLSEVQRVHAKAQSAVDMKKQNLAEETKKRKELVKSMAEVRGERINGVVVCEREEDEQTA